MTGVVLYDDGQAREFEPFALTRPVSELRAGALLIRERWETALGVKALGFIGAAHLADFEETGAPGAFADADIPAGALIANARALPMLETTRDTEAACWTIGGRVAAVRVPKRLPAVALRDGTAELETLLESDGRRSELVGRWLDAPWDLVRHLPSMLTEDVLRIGPTLETEGSHKAAVIGSHAVFAEVGSTIEPHVMFDATNGPILVRRGAHVQAFTRLVGPCAIGYDSMILGERVATCSIGDVCRVHGEVSTTIFVGHANKAHDGFLGHSVVGRWANLGASTVNSNLKNTYGTVSMWTPRGLKDTGMQFLGVLIGDHAKTGIGTRITTGSVIGAGANVVYDGLAPKVVAPFSWGPNKDVYDLERFLQVVERVVARRNETLGERSRRQLAAAHSRRWTI
ncbi:MAG TPA: putative sugar nucleotidyl transferase [Gemmatimonadaceae bacterium]|nr:putative sugar nucleotidyl transferase [Gemmatimonadaceae bacterium]